MKFRLVLAALMGAACLVSSCGGDDGPGTINPPPPTPPSRGTADSLLTSWFERAYNTQDADLYEEMLDPAFTFVFLPEDVDSFEVVLGLDQNGAWNKTKDRQSTNNMFSNNTVSDVELELSVTQNLPYSGDDCDNCRELLVGVDLSVTTNPPGADVLILDIVSDQSFIVRPDPADTTLWVIFRQVDQERPGKSPSGTDGERGISSNEDRTWGQLKAEFF